MDKETGLTRGKRSIAEQLGINWSVKRVLKALENETGTGLPQALGNRQPAFLPDGTKANQCWGQNCPTVQGESDQVETGGRHPAQRLLREMKDV